MKNRLASRFANESNKTVTENFAETYRSTLNAVLDFFYLAPSRQGQDNTDLWLAAWEEDSALALKSAFYLRDIRGGKGQRKTFRDILDWLARYKKSVFNQVVAFVAEYGRWDDILPFVNFKSVQSVVRDQLLKDTSSGRPSLLGKWMPSENASSKDTKELARAWMEVLEMSPRSYRKMLSELRKRIKIVERSMSAQEWDKINYSAVPSKAMKLYRKAFGKHDEDRFGEFIEKAIKGEVKIQSGTLYPHDIVSEFFRSKDSDNALEAQWNQLPNYFGDEQRNVLPMVDVSGSMGAVIPGTRVEAIHVSIALGLYCAERNQGAFQNYLMTFSGRPSIEKLTGRTLRTKISHIYRMNWDMNTDLQAAFSALLRMAVEENVPAEEMPSMILIISDMEFDACVHGLNLTGIRKQYQAAGYEMPFVTFWNVMARNKQAPALNQEKGVFLVGGFSAETVGKVLRSEATNPEALMLEVLNSDRYAFVNDLKL